MNIHCRQSEETAIRRLGAAGCGCLALVLCAGAASAETRAVVELFTSQGCSSCPPADEVLGELARDPQILALSFAVDYWDFLGWKDTFARPEFSRRQKGYAEARGDGAVYTPQVVVNGRNHLVGSDRTAIEAEIAEGAGSLTVIVNAVRDGDRIIVNLPDGPKPTQGDVSVWIASYREPVRVTIADGENAGSAITYTNLVDRWQVLGMWDGSAMTVALPVSDIADETTAGFAVVVQSKSGGRPGPILGATRVPF